MIASGSGRGAQTVASRSPRDVYADNLLQRIVQRTQQTQDTYCNAFSQNLV
jgi:hypothetical protein